MKRRTQNDSQLKLSDPGKGLGSVINRKFVSQVLEKSSAQEIADLLASIRYRPPAKHHVSQAVVNDTLEQAVSAYVKSPEGMRHLLTTKKRRVEKEVEIWLQSPRGLDELNRVKTELLADKVAKDSDVITAACIAAVATAVRKWLDSPLGKAQLEAEKLRAIKDHAARIQASTATSWIEREMKKVNNG